MSTLFPHSAVGKRSDALSEPLVALPILTLNPPTPTAQFLSGFLSVMFFPNRGPKTKANAGFSRASISDHEKFISRARKNPLIPAVGVRPKPTVVALKLAFVFRFVIWCQPELSGNQTPASMAVEVFD